MTAPPSLAKLLAALSLSPPPCLQLPPQPDRRAWAPMIAKNLRPPSSIGPADALSVTNPALSNATILFYKSGHYNVQEVVRDEPATPNKPAVREPEENVLYRFSKAVRRAGLLRECRRRMFFENKREEKQRKTKEAARKRKYSKRRPQAKDPKPARDPSPKRKEDDGDDNDNWDLPEGELPYCSNLR